MDEVIRLTNVSLYRRTQEEFSYDFKKTILAFFEGKYRHPVKKLVLNEINLVIEKGEKLGIVGANGSGKSTLLKVISGILKPTTGQVRVKGKVAPVIELEAGFDRKLSVIDNIVLYGVMLGFSLQEMKHRAASILEFADLEKEALVPVQGLSSGMIARLGFAIATDVRPDILILDEVLSVGDERFKRKCKQRIQELWDEKTTVLFVSHDLEMVADSCERLIWLDKGEIKYIGEVKDTLRLYLQEVGRAEKSFFTKKK